MAVGGEQVTLHISFRTTSESEVGKATNRGCGCQSALEVEGIFASTLSEDSMDLTHQGRQAGS